MKINYHITVEGSIGVGKTSLAKILAEEFQAQLILEKLFGTLNGKKITILGFSFKANTNDTRESSAIQICKDLLQEGAKLYIHDPKVSSEQISEDLDANLYSYESDMENNEKPLWFKVFFKKSNTFSMVCAHIYKNRNIFIYVFFKLIHS